MTSVLHVGARHWDHVVPLALGDVPDASTIRLSRFDSTPDLWDDDVRLDASETSFSRYVRARARGDDRVTALPVFLMRGFRHRCIIVTEGSSAHTAKDLTDARIGLTGWADSGNVWTRAILREAGVDLSRVEWSVGRLTASHPVADRIGLAAPPPNVHPLRDDEPLIDALQRGVLDAVMTPFMPPGLDDNESALRPLFVDPRAEERRFLESHGFVPGIHLLGVRTSVLADDRGAARRLFDAFDRAKHISAARRHKLLDVTPWQNVAFAWTTRAFGGDWMPYGLLSDMPMITAFQDELVAQGLLTTRVPIDELFPIPLESHRKDAA